MTLALLAPTPITTGEVLSPAKEDALSLARCSPSLVCVSSTSASASLSCYSPTECRHPRQPKEAASSHSPLQYPAQFESVDMMRLNLIPAGYAAHSTEQTLSGSAEGGRCPALPPARQAQRSKDRGITTQLTSRVDVILSLISMPRSNGMSSTFTSVSSNPAGLQHECY